MVLVLQSIFGQEKVLQTHSLRFRLL